MYHFEMSRIPGNIEEISTYDLLNLIKDVFDCIQDANGNSPFIDIMNEEILMATFENKRFRVMIQDCTRFQ